jgi:predicted nucleotidyltransferase
MERLRDLVKEERKEIKEVLSNCLEKEEPILFAYLHGSFAERDHFEISILQFLWMGQEFQRRELSILKCRFL